MAKKLKTLIIIGFTLLGLGAFSLSSTSFALCTDTSSCIGKAIDPACQKFLDPNGNPTTSSKKCEDETPAACKSIDRSTSKGEDIFDNCLIQQSLLPKTNPIIKDLNIFVNFLSGLVGIVVIASIIVGGIQYSMAGGNPEAVNKAKQRLTNAALAFVAYLLIFGFLQWIIPGGIFNP